MNLTQAGHLGGAVALEIERYSAQADANASYALVATIQDRDTLDRLVRLLDEKLDVGPVPACIAEYELRFRRADGIVVTFGYTCGSGGAYFISTQASDQSLSVLGQVKLPDEFRDLVSVQLAEAPPMPVATPPHSLLATTGYLSCLGMHFDPVPTTDPSAAGVISSEQALSAAWQDQPDLKSATILDVSLGRLGNAPGSGTTTSVLADTPLVWVVSFSGVVSVSSGPPGAVHHTSNEYSVVIDATSAKVLVSFPLCNDTLPPTQTP